MKTRIKTKFGMCNLEKDPDPKFKRVTFDKKTTLGKDGMSCFMWILSLEKLKSIL